MSEILNTFTTNVAACNREKSFIFDKQLALKATDAVPVRPIHSLHTLICVIGLLPDEWKLERFPTV